MVERVVDVDLLINGIARVLHVVDSSRVIKPRRVSAAAHRRHVAKRVGAVAADNAHRNAASDRSRNCRTIASAVQVDSNLPGLSEGEPSREIRRIIPRLENDVDKSVPGARDG